MGLSLFSLVNSALMMWRHVTWWGQWSIFITSTHILKKKHCRPANFGGQVIQYVTVSVIFTVLKKKKLNFRSRSSKRVYSHSSGSVKLHPRIAPRIASDLVPFSSLHSGTITTTFPLSKIDNSAVLCLTNLFSCFNNVRKCKWVRLFLHFHVVDVRVINGREVLKEPLTERTDMKLFTSCMFKLHRYIWTD